MNQELMKRLSELARKEQEGLAGTKGTAAQDAGCVQMQNSEVLVQMHFYERFAYVPCRARSHVELIYMCAGQTIHRFNQQEVVLVEGELLWVNPKAKWELLPCRKESAAVRIILLPGFFPWAFHVPEKEDNLLCHFLVNYMQGNMPDSSYLHFHVSDIPAVQKLMEAVLWVMLDGYLEKSAVVQCSMKLLIMLLTGCMDRMETGEHSFEHMLVLRVLRYIEAHYRDGGMAELCAYFGYDMYWLSRAIKRITGKTYKELLQVKRMKRAAYLLENSRMPVAKISLAVGYRNTSYFHRMFREYYGVSPKQYRDKV